ncbi:HGGxSTG domain-containing protein [Sphingomonas endophytica]|uniref:HGGxSTG domain-containing protein n=1 Tax=Sphingomonas endophytica TaxID=869719 RepID=UPI003D156D79
MRIATTLRCRSSKAWPRAIRRRRCCWCKCMSRMTRQSGRSASLGRRNGCRLRRCLATSPQSCCAPLRGKWKRWPGCVAAGNKSCAMSMSIIAAGRPSLPRTSTPGGREMEKLTINPMQPERLASAPRCLARTRSGAECQSPAVKGRKRCRMHGGTNPGAPEGNSNARKHGGRSARAMAAARYLRGIARLVR